MLITSQYMSVGVTASQDQEDTSCDIVTIVSRFGLYGFIFVKIQQVLEDQIVSRRLLWEFFLFSLFISPCPLHLQIHSDSDIGGLIFLLSKCEEVTAHASLALFRRLVQILQLFF